MGVDHIDQALEKLRCPDATCQHCDHNLVPSLWDKSSAL
jgi:hypothetical protein